MIVDVHGHITSPELFKRFPMPPALADIEGMLDRKARHGIELTIVGSPVGEGTMMPVPGLDNYAQPLDRLEAFHGWLAETCAKHAGRLAAYAYTNPLGDDALLTQTARTVKDGGFVGVIANSSVRGEYLDTDAADPFWAMVDELDVPVFLHPPAEPVGTEAFRDFRLVEQVARFHDVAAGLAAIVFGGVLERHPDLKIIGATGGGGIALLASRLDVAFRPPHWQRGPSEGPPSDGDGSSQGRAARPTGDGLPSAGSPKGSGGPPPGASPIHRYENRIPAPPSTYLQRIWVDTASPSRALHGANLELMGAERLLFGTDSPPLATSLDDAIDTVRSLPVSDEDKQKIFSENARRLFKLE